MPYEQNKFYCIQVTLIEVAQKSARRKKWWDELEGGGNGVMMCLVAFVIHT